MVEGNSKHWLIIGAVLAVMAGTLVTVRPWEPRYQGKTVSRWFEEYVSYPSESRLVLGVSLEDWHIGTGGRPYSGRSLHDPKTHARLPDPPLNALRALGSRAVPTLIRQLRPSGLESLTYARLYLGLPEAFRDSVPNPWRSAYRRGLTVEALASLGPDAAESVPALLSLLDLEHRTAPGRPAWISGGPGTPVVQIFSLFPRSRPSTEPIAIAIVSIVRDPQSLSTIIRDLGQKGNHPAVVELLEASGWSGPEVPGFLGSALSDPDPILRQKALQLLEELGRPGAEASAPILTALRDPDEQVRYRAARALESSGANSAPVIAGLQAAAQDTNNMVQTVATRALLRLRPQPSSVP